MNDKPSFFSELKRRNVYKVAVAYAIVGWLLVQIATQVFPFLEIPNWVVRLVIALVVIGFPIALVLAWAFEATPEGIKRTEVADAMPPTTSKKRHAWIYIAAIGAALSVGLFFLGRYTMRTTIAPLSGPPAKSIGVLPFENLSDDKANAYFADGIQDEILTKLASVADLKVISRTSTAKYKSKPEDLKTVAQQLGVANVVEGTVQRAADKVRVNVQLIDARADSHLWAKSYDRDIKDVFAVESEVSQEIADALQAKLSPNESNVLATAPTKDPEAYDLFLKAEGHEKEAESAIKAELFDRAAALYQQALSRDPNFALAAARLVESRMTRHWFVRRLSDAELPAVKSIAEQAVALAPDLAESHIALGIFYYLGHLQYDEALSELQRALELQPGDTRALEFSGYVHRRQGRWKLALSELTQAEDRDPRNGSLVANIGAAYCYLRMWTEA
ncbi:MAG: tetratricopeptide repeat protein, partial [Chthoniobacterales bacterium]